MFLHFMGGGRLIFVWSYPKYCFGWIDSLWGVLFLSSDEKSTKRNSLKEPPLRRRFLENLPGGGAVAQRKAQRLSPNVNLLNAAPMDASVPAGRLFVLRLFRDLTARTLTF